MGSLGLNVEGDFGLEIGDGPCPTKPIVSGNVKINVFIDETNKKAFLMNHF